MRPTRTASGRRRSWVAGALLALALVSVLSVGYVGWVGSERALHPPASKDPPKVADYRLPLHDVAFVSRDGTHLAGWFIASTRDPRTAPTVVLMHGYGGQKEDMLPLADHLAGLGYNLLLFDFRGRGGSGGDVVTVGARERGDAAGAVDYLASRGDVDMRRVGLHGSSMGGAVAIMAGAADPRVAGVVAEAPFVDVPTEVGFSFERRIGLPAFPFAPITVAIAEVRAGVRISDVSPLRAVVGLAGRPLLVVDDELDVTIAPGSAKAVFEAAREPKRYWPAPGAAHGRGHRDARGAFRAEVARFWAGVFEGGS